MNRPGEAATGRHAWSQAGRAIALSVRVAFVRLGVLPFLLLLAVLVFALMSDNFLTGRNLLNVLRQSAYLVLVSMGQMFALLTGGFDLSVGTILALTSVVVATAMAGAYIAMPDATGLSILIGIFAGVAAGTAIGVVNGIGIALFNISPFMMSLGMASVGFGLALYMTGGTPVYGMPMEFGDTFGFGTTLGLPTPVLVTGALIVVLYFVVNWTRTRPLLLCRRGERQGRAAVRHRHPAHPVPGLRALRSDGRDCRRSADRTPGHRRSEHRGDHASRVHRGLRDCGRQPARRHWPGSRTSSSGRCSSGSFRTA